MFEVKSYAELSTCDSLNTRIYISVEHNCDIVSDLRDDIIIYFWLVELHGPVQQMAISQLRLVQTSSRKRLLFRKHVDSQTVRAVTSADSWSNQLHERNM